MGQKLVTTTLRGMVMSFLLDEENKAMEIHPYAENLKTLVGDIYAGRVANVVKNINAAFVDIGEEKPAYLSMENSDYICYADGRPGDQRPKQGDLILVQVVKDAHKTKAPKLTCEFDLAGQFAVLTTGHPTLGMSSKITDPDDRKRLKKLFLPNMSDRYSFIVRTNAAEADESEIKAEIEELTGEYKRIMEMLPYANAGSCLHRALSGHLKLLRDANMAQVESYVYDDPTLHKQAVEMGLPAMLYNDSYPLSALYNLEKQLERATKEKVWLKSGASIVIQSTEALVAIDVNTEKTQTRKNPEDVILSTNLEAAEEIARQMRLRNLSGIIIADFIDMASSDYRKTLCERVEELCLSDRIRTRFIDMTPLGLVEITRKKMEKSLNEKLKDTDLGKK